MWCESPSRCARSRWSAPAIDRVDGEAEPPDDAWAAWAVQGAKVKVWNGADEKTYDLAVTSPCEVSVIENSADGSASTTKPYTVKNGQLIMGLGEQLQATRSEKMPIQRPLVGVEEGPARDLTRRRPCGACVDAAAGVIMQPCPVLALSRS